MRLGRAETSIPLSDRPAAYSAMPIDFRKSAIVAKSVPVPYRWSSTEGAALLSSGVVGIGRADSRRRSKWLPMPPISHPPISMDFITTTRSALRNSTGTSFPIRGRH